MSTDHKQGFLYRVHNAAKHPPSFSAIFGTTYWQIQSSLTPQSFFGLYLLIALPLHKAAIAFAPG